MKIYKISGVMKSRFSFSQKLIWMNFFQVVLICKFRQQYKKIKKEKSRTSCPNPKKFSSLDVWYFQNTDSWTSHNFFFRK